MNRNILNPARVPLVVILFIFGASAHLLPAATSVSQHGITWTFDKDYPTGQYANGDFWVIGPIKIIGISPESTLIDGRASNGSMINPLSGTTVPQGFDSFASNYNSTLNVARPNGQVASNSNPLNIPTNSSLVSTISFPTSRRPQLTDAAVLTIVESRPAEGAFRPPYQGTNKAQLWNKNNLDYTILQSLAKPSSIIPLSTVESRIERPWIEIQTEHTGRTIHPSNNQPDYGREIAWYLGDALLSLHLNYSRAEKERLFIRTVQIGIDIYGAAANGAVWQPNGGHNQGRKMPLILAGLALKDEEILKYADAQKYYIFHEDRATFIVSQSDVGRPLYTADGRPREMYLQEDVGIPEWGEKHATQPNRDGRNWDTYYRDTFGQSTVAHALAANLTPGARALWNWEPFFQYIDRFWSIETSGKRIPLFHNLMYTSSRSILPEAPTPPSRAIITVSPL